MNRLEGSSVSFPYQGHLIHPTLHLSVEELLLLGDSIPSGASRPLNGRLITNQSLTHSSIRKPRPTTPSWEKSGTTMKLKGV